MTSSLDSLNWQQIPWQAYAVAAVVVIALVWRVYLWVKGLIPITKDSQRLFTHAQRMAAIARCGGRCEHKPLLWRRCPATTGLQGDHIYPHSKGGRTIESNLQMLCAKHNRRKTATVPSRAYIWRLERRRRGYFPAGASTQVSWK